MMKKRFYFYIICALCAGLLCGCGGSKEVKAPKTATVTDAQPVVTAASTTTQAEIPKDADGFYITDDYVICTAETVNVRTAPTTSASIYLLLATGEVVHRIGYNSEWTKINYDNTSFYVHSDLVAPTEKPADGIIAGETDDTEEDTTDESTEEEAEEKVDITTQRSLPKKIVIDPGNQATINVELIPIGPESEETKQGATQGNVGSYLGTKEFDLNLVYAQMLKAELEGRGYEVILTRETSDIDISNKARAELANASGASAFLRIEMNFSANNALTGAMSICMRENTPYNPELYEESHAFASRVLQGVLTETGANNQGVYETNKLAAINWSTIPVCSIEVGFLSNETEESLLVTEDYQRKVIKGIADGIDKYFN